MMAIMDFGNTVINYLNNADERLLNVIKAVVVSYRENDLAAFIVDGPPLTRKQYIKELLNAETEIERGKIHNPLRFRKRIRKLVNGKTKNYLDKYSRTQFKSIYDNYRVTFHILTKMTD
jgi:hypothetical protein